MNCLCLKKVDSLSHLSHLSQAPQKTQKPHATQPNQLNQLNLSLNLQLGEIQKHKSCEARCAVPKGFELDPILSAAPLQPQGKLIIK